MKELYKFIVTKYSGFFVTCLESLFIFCVGWYLVKIFIHFLEKLMTKAQVDPIVINFINMMVKVGLRIIVVLTAVSQLGVPVTSFVAVLTTAGAAIVLGLQDSMKGVISGIVILFAKPFVKGDIIEVKQYIGKIQEIQLLYTILMTFDNKMVVIPNQELSSSTFVNYSHEDIRRVDLVFDVHYDSDIEKAKAIIKDVVENHALSLKEPLPYVRVSEYKESSISINIRVWTQTENYYELQDDLKENIKTALDQNGIQLPYRQLDIHIQDQSIQ